MYKIKFKDGTEKEFESLIGQDLSYTNLNDAILKNADLYNTNLHKADLCNANLYNTNLYNANLYNARSIFTFQANKQLAIAFNYNSMTYINIGCLTKISDVWLKEFKIIGIDKEYSKIETKAYNSFIKFINDNKDELFSLK